MPTKGYDVFFYDPGKMDKVTCRVCLTECDVRRNVTSATSYVEALGQSKRLHDRFTCPHTEEGWHIEAQKLVFAKEQTPSKRLRMMIQSDLEELLLDKMGHGGRITEIKSLFHRLWTFAVGTKDYDKSEWKRLSDLLGQEGIIV